MSVSIQKRGFKSELPRKILLVIAPDVECRQAVAYAARSAERTNARLVLLQVVDPERFERWFGVEDIMQAEAIQKAEVLLERYSQQAQSLLHHAAELVIRVGKCLTEVLDLINKDRQIALLVLPASMEGEGVSSLIAALLGNNSGFFPIPLVLVPGELSDEEIMALA